MLAAHPRVPLVAALVGVISTILLAPVPPPPPPDGPLTIGFVPGTAEIVTDDLAALPAFIRAPHDHVVIASEQTSAEPAQLADRRVAAIAAVLRAAGEEQRVVVVTTEIEVAGQPPEPPTDNATVELRP